MNIEVYISAERFGLVSFVFSFHYQYKMNSLKEWFLIQSVLDGSSTLSCDRTPMEDYTRSQVYVYPTPEYTDAELWRWDSNYLQNKKSGLVLDIRKGKCTSDAWVYELNTQTN